MRFSLRLSPELTTQTGRVHVHDLTEAGFSFGRSPDATLTVIDQTNQVSGIHFELSLVGSDLLITDLSSGGTALNSKHNRLNRGQPAPLNPQSTIILPHGSVELTVEADEHDDGFAITEAEDFFDIESKRRRSSQKGSFLDFAPPELLADDETDHLVQEDLTLSLLSDQEAPKYETSSSGSKPDPSADQREFHDSQIETPLVEKKASGLNWMTDSEGYGGEEPVVFERNEERETTLVSGIGQESIERTEAPTTVDPRMQKNNEPSPEDKINEAAIRSIFNGLAIEIDDLSLDQRIEYAAVIGKGFHAMAEAIRMMLDTRREVKRILGVAGTQVEIGANPLKVARDATSAVDGLLHPLSSGFLFGEEAIADSLNSMQSHQMALVGGIRTATKLSLEAFDPAEIEKRASKRGVLNSIPMVRKAELWDRFVEGYEDVSDRVDSDIRMVIGRELDRLYSGDGE